MKAAMERGSQGYMSYYADDSVEVPNGAPLIQGKTEIAKGMSFLDDKNNRLIWTPVGADISASADLGYTYGNFEFHSINKEGKPIIGNPSAAILEASVGQDDQKGGPERGYDAVKKVNGRKRHLLVDTLGLVCKVQVTAANVGDRDGAMTLLGRLDRRRFPRLRHGWADSGYRGPFLDWTRTRRGIAFQVAGSAKLAS